MNFNCVNEIESTADYGGRILFGVPSLTNYINTGNSGIKHKTNLTDTFQTTKKKNVKKALTIGAICAGIGAALILAVKKGKLNLPSIKKPDSSKIKLLVKNELDKVKALPSKINFPKKAPKS